MRGISVAVASWLVAGSALMSIGCVGGAPAVSPSIPKDPTPLAKCKVSASKLEPLVTEWPASEKSRLESLLERGGVAVSYSGCEMRVLAECNVKGSYAWKRTTLATDTVEITDEDQLYAKLPLGAARLSADLERSGRLAVRTTVAGQYALTGAGPGDVTSDGACAQATHLVTGLSVGAFKMLAGGKAKVGGSAGVGDVGVSASHSASEDVLTEAGDPSACGPHDGAGDAPNAQCKSPVQVFLAPIPNRSAPGARAGIDDDAKAPPNAVRVSFKAPRDGERWSLLTGEGKLVCDLPCARWVAPSSGYVVQLDAEKKSDIVSIKVPDNLGYSAGRQVDATPLPAKGGRGGGIALVVVGAIGTGVGAFATAIFALVPSAPSPAIPATIAGVGLVSLTAGIVVLSGVRSHGTLDMRLDEGRSADASRVKLHLGPGFLEAERGGAKGTRVFVTPGGVVGSF